MAERDTQAGRPPGAPSAGRRLPPQRLAGARGEAVTELPIPRDVECEQREVSSGRRTRGRGDEREQSFGCVEPEPGSDERAADRYRESRDLGLGVPGSVHPGEVQTEPDGTDT